MNLNSEEEREGDDKVKELIKVEINENDEQIVSARLLHEFLEVKSRFNDWIKNRIEKYGFIEGKDFTKILVQQFSRVVEQYDYMLKVSMAKELCMLESNEKGSSARKYFLRIEDYWNSPEMVMARANKIQQKTINDYKAKLLEYKPAVDLYNNLMESKDTLDMGKVAKTLNFKNIGRNKLFEILRNEEVLQINNEPYQDYVNRGWFKTIPSTYTDQNNVTHIKIKTVVYGKGLQAISKILIKLGYIKRNQNYSLSAN